MTLPALPPDFEDFWRGTAEEAAGATLDFEVRQNKAFDLPGFSVQTFEFRGISGERLHGWIARSESAPKPAPGFLWIPPYGRESLLPNQYGTREGFVSLSFNFFGHGAFHQEKYTPPRGYFAEGIEGPRTFVFRKMFQNAYLASRILGGLDGVDSERIGSMGMSQGGGISIWLGAWCETIKAVCADMPFLGNIGEAITRTVYRYPTKELTDYAEAHENGMETVLSTLGYFDTVRQAAFCRVPTHVSLGIKDPAAKPHTVEAVFASLPRAKVLRRYEIGHDWFPAMVENNRHWLLENLR
ncbi:MAG TPA: acetylxylan esterase [Fimbriimonadaceae bacterium]|nr:acetylxylan esterase [Fimbriimonadaceae bacterium]